MTAKNFGMILIGMMMLSTTNSFGAVKNSHFQTPKTEKTVKNIKKQDKVCDCKTGKNVRQKQPKIQKKNHCTCKGCKKVQQKYHSSCKKQNHKMNGYSKHK